uniref:Serine/threonine-protein kinase TOR n=1 Tax=Arcella intermedia TaxID=1963864 RepID=A0A6B2KWH7_9EUKA
MDFANDLSQREKAIRLFGLVVRSVPKLLRPYMEPIINSLMKKLTTTDTDEVLLQAYCLQALGDMSSVSGDYMIAHLDELLPLVLESFQDQQSSQKRLIALQTLGDLIENTGYAIEPFVRYPKLLETILQKMRRAGSPTLLCQLIKLIGIIGAIDPYRHKMLQLELLELDGQAEKSGHRTSFHKEFIRGISQQSEDYYPSITLHLLLRILKNPRSNSVTYLTLVIQIVVTIFKSIGVRCVGYLKHFIVPFIDVMNAFGDGNNLREFVLTQLKGLVSIIQHHTRDHLPHLMRIMTDYWYHENLQEPIILLLQEISNVLGDEFLPCLNTFLPKMLAVLSSKSKHSVVVLNTLKDFGSLLDPYIPLLIPEILKLFDNTNTQDVSINALRTIGLLSYNHDLQPYVISIFHHLQETIDSNITKDQKILEQSLKTVCDLLVNTGPLSYTYIGLFTPLLSKRQISFPQYSDIVAKIQRHEEIIPEIPKEYLETTYNKDDPNVPPKAGKTNVKILSTAWSTTDCVSDTSWQEWFRRISVTLLENSPSPALRCCAWLNYHNTGFRELFNPAFLSCWETINEDLKGEIIKSIRFTISPESTTPSEVLHSILDLAEFMDRSEKPLTIPIKDVAYLSEKCQAFAKALYYWEKLFRETKPTEDILDHLISMSDKLGQHDAANGLHKLAKTMNLNVDISWLEKLQQWINVLNQYDQIYKHNPDKKILLGRMRCLFNLGAWKELEEVSELALIDSTDKAVSYEIAEFAVKADFYLGNWTNLERHLACLDKYSADRAFYRAVVAISEDDYETCRKSIFHCRELVSNKLTTLMGESYSRAYSDMVRIQQLSELEEIITYKQTLEPEKKLTIQKLWKNRLLGMEKSVDVWQNVLALRTLVLPPNEDPITWVKFANLVKKNRRYRRSLRIICSLLGIDINEQHPVKLPAETNPNVRYAYLKLLYEMGDRDSSYQHMMEWASTFRYSDVENTKQAQVYVTLTHWNLIKHEHNLNQKQIQIMINTCAAATSNHEEWHKAWHSWAILNYTVLRYYAKQQEDHPEISKFLLPSVNGFIQSIKFSPEENLQDNLRLLSLWFNYGNQSEVENAILEGIDMINIDTWLSAIPQIIARIQNPNIKNGIQHLLQVLGAKHPQALVFPIAVARKSPNRARQLAAQTVLNNMRQHSPKLVAEAQLVGDELIRTAILWNEKWFKALEEASQFYYVERRVDKMLAVLKPLHSLIKKGAHTANEKAFASVFEKDLGKAWENCKEFKKTRKEQCINIAWDVYAHVYRLIKKKLQTDFDKLHLSQISPALHQQTNYDLTVPGTYNKHYKANKPIVQIKSFVPIFKVIPSKQKPRKLVICGSDGNEYPFLLKGHEDLRQDERVMQLFGLVNTLLENDNITSKHHLKIQGYSVIPLSSESGLIEWLPHSDTLHELLSIYRKNHDIPLESELTCMQKFVQKNEYYILPAINKLEIFEYALEQTPGNDLQQIIWLNSKSSEQWLDRRTVYTRSLATMSMVGYILGLGDRHPNNLMLNRNSGQIIHIDFGDCFEIAQLREKFAEKVPFRLTRMLVNAMEVTGIEGTFAITCEEIMRVLRQNKESIKAVLEAFVYDPLLSWRFVCQTTGPREENEIEFAQILAKTAVREVDSIGGLYDSPKANKPTKIKKDWEDDEFTKDQGLEVNAKALRILERIDDKLSGRDFPKQAEELEVGEQVDLLLKRATDVELLSQAYLGWCPYW